MISAPAMPLRKRIALIAHDNRSPISSSGPASTSATSRSPSNRSTADFLLSSPLMNEEYRPAAAGV
jgi:hypothetical protein